MKTTTDSETGPAHAWAVPKWLVWTNMTLVFFMVFSILLAAGVWFSDRLMMGMVNQFVSPRINRLVQKNPDLLYNLSKTLTTQSLAPQINRLLQEDPHGLSRMVKSIDMVLMAGTLNHVFKENPEQINLLLKNLDAQALTELNSHLLRNNRPLLVALMTTFDHQAMGAVVVETISKDPRFFSKAVEGLQSAPFSSSINTTLRSQKVFLSDFLGTLDMGSLAAIIDKIAKEHPEFMNELVDKIVELIRKDFMKSGIY
jgi:hypothetical protein